MSIKKNKKKKKKILTVTQHHTAHLRRNQHRHAKDGADDDEQQHGRDANVGEPEEPDKRQDPRLGRARRGPDPEFSGRRCRRTGVVDARPRRYRCWSRCGVEGYVDGGED